MKRYFPLILVMYIACNSAGTGHHPAGPSNEEKQDYFPVPAFIAGQVHLVDSFQFPITRFASFNGKHDTTVISQDAFEALAHDFMFPDINDPAIKKYYIENNFSDQSLSGFTFTYAATDKNMAIQRLDVLIHPDPAIGDKVKSIYIEKSITQGDTQVFKKMFWKADREFQIITTTKNSSGAAVVDLLKVKWY